MGKVDILAKSYMKNKKVFADAFNYYMYDGKRVIDPEKLYEVDTAEIAVPYGEDDSGIKLQPVQKIRDVIYSVMSDDDVVYMLLGIENQSDTHYAMPVKNMLYDAMEYAAQIQEADRAHRKAQNYGSKAEFLSGFHKDDRLIPVVTLVIYWGAGEWTGPKCIHDMLSVKNEAVLKFVGNYNINLIIPDKMSYEEADKFSSDLGKALMYIKNMRNQTELEKMLNSVKYKTIDVETGILLNEIMNLKYTIPKEQEVLNMCYAVECIKNEAAAKAAAEATAKAEAKAAEAAARAAAEAEAKAAKAAAEATAKAEAKAAKATVIATISAYREFEISENDIEKRIMNKFNLTREKAREYMDSKIA